MMHKSQASRKFPESVNDKQAKLKYDFDKKLTKLNKHINFDKEITKSSARKTPTTVTCCECKKKFILPFKPRKPEIYCDECFKRKKPQINLKKPARVI
ncbi:MAG: hypothetical protein WC755_08135 [Candidatus Woesearchaeota archaeon]|jgi:hypothetical protein